MATMKKEGSCAYKGSADTKGVDVKLVKIHHMIKEENKKCLIRNY
jgi:hypothetical protein